MKKTFLIDSQKFTVKPVSQITFREDQRIREILFESDYPSDLSPVELCRMILTPESDADFSKCTFEQLQDIISGYMAERQFFFLNLPKSIADSVTASLKSLMNLTGSPDGNGSLPPTSKKGTR